MAWPQLLPQKTLLEMERVDMASDVEARHSFDSSFCFLVLLLKHQNSRQGKLAVDSALVKTELNRGKIV